VGFWTEDFKEQLENMLEQKGCSLKTYESYYDHEHVDFVLVFNSKEDLDRLITTQDDNGITKFEQDFRLVSSKQLSTSNMYLFNKDGQIHKYQDVLEIVDEFIQVRLAFYTKRKEYLLSKMRMDISMLEAKARFIRQIIANEISINNIPKQDIVKQLVKFKYPTFTEEEDEYGYLLRMPLYSLTMERKLELENTIAKMASEMRSLERTSESQLWDNELNEFDTAYKSFLVGTKKREKQPHGHDNGKRAKK
jgi:DNA topoisomerase II